MVFRQNGFSYHSQLCVWVITLKALASQFMVCSASFFFSFTFGLLGSTE